MGDKLGHPFRGNQWTGSVVYDTYGVDPRAKVSFDKAMDFVREQYAKELGDLPESSADVAVIKLVKASRMTGRNGIFLPPGPQVDAAGKPVRDESGKMVRGRRAEIQIRAGRRSAREFIGTIVHELKHLEQYRAGERVNYDESAADLAGAMARTKFDYMKNPPKGGG
jgi:hypothetical protein